MDKKVFINIESNIKTIENLSNDLIGCIDFDGRTIDTSITKENDYYKIRINEILSLDLSSSKFRFQNDDYRFEVEAPITAHKNSINVVENWGTQHSEGRIYSFQNFDKNSKALYRAFYKIESNNFFLTYFDDISYKTETFISRGLLPLNVNKYQFFVYTYHSDYLIVESREKIDYELFTESCYNILIGVGFVSGKFFQNEVFTFKDFDNELTNQFCYRKLRSSSFSIYHAVTRNPYGYKDFIGDSIAKELYDNNTLVPFSSQNLSKLTELIQNNNQIQYALVLFNEANSNNLSLLVKNNCFYIVLEVLKKFFYDILNPQLPNNYSRVGNVEKYKILFNLIVNISDKDVETIKRRNLYLHGDIKDLEGQQMVDDMQKQITLIYRLLLTYIGFNGYIIDHYAIRNGSPDKAFIKCN